MREVFYEFANFERYLNNHSSLTTACFSIQREAKLLLIPDYADL